MRLRQKDGHKFQASLATWWVTSQSELQSNILSRKIQMKVRNHFFPEWNEERSCLRLNCEGRGKSWCTGVNEAFGYKNANPERHLNSSMTKEAATVGTWEVKVKTCRGLNLIRGLQVHQTAQGEYIQGLLTLKRPSLGCCQEKATESWMLDEEVTQTPTTMGRSRLYMVHARVCMHTHVCVHSCTFVHTCSVHCF